MGPNTCRFLIVVTTNVLLLTTILLLVETSPTSNSTNNLNNTVARNKPKPATPVQSRTRNDTNERQHHHRQARRISRTPSPQQQTITASNGPKQPAKNDSNTNGSQASITNPNHDESDEDQPKLQNRRQMRPVRSYQQYHLGSSAPAMIISKQTNKLISTYNGMPSGYHQTPLSVPSNNYMMSHLSKPHHQGMSSLINSGSSTAGSSLSLYSVPSLSAMQQLAMQLSVASAASSNADTGSSSSSASSSSTFHTMGQGQQQSSSNHNNQFGGNSLDGAWDGSYANYGSFENDLDDVVVVEPPAMSQKDLTTTPPSGNLAHSHNNSNSWSSSGAYSIDGIMNCGRQQVNQREPRIVGGNSTYEGEFPWAVSIQRHGNHHCGGVIVGRRWILTAAHCVRSQLVANLLVRTGGHTLSRSANSLNSHLERDYLVETIIMHNDFSKYDNLTASQLKSSSANTNNADIALLKLRQDIQWNEFAWPVCFAQRNVGNLSGHDAVAIGWGKLNEKSEDFSNELQKVKLNIIDNKVCQNWFRQAGREMTINERIICAGFKAGGKDACHGDSGGPLLSKLNGQFVVVGVVSTGIGCARPLLPGLYSRVSSYIDWIEEHVH